MITPYAGSDAVFRSAHAPITVPPSTSPVLLDQMAGEGPGEPILKDYIGTSKGGCKQDAPMAGSHQ